MIFKGIREGNVHEPKGKERVKELEDGLRVTGKQRVRN